jgi:hypothetical protein
MELDLFQLQESADRQEYSTGHIDGSHSKYCQDDLVQKRLDSEWEVVCSHEKILMLDYDMKIIPEVFFEIKKLYEYTFQVKLQYEAYSSRNGNTHVILNLDRAMSEHERISWQAIFGSDPKREALSLIRLNAGQIDPIVLYMRKDRIKCLL